MSDKVRHLVAIGGGNGCSQVLLGAQPYFGRRTAVIAVTDSGRSTGVARTIGQIPAPGDLRNCLATLADAPDSLLPTLLQHRFHTDDVPALNGMAFGNLLIAALTQLRGSFIEAIDTVAELVDTPVRVLPVSGANTHLCAELADGRIVEQELAVRAPKKPPISRLFLQDRTASAYPPVLDALLQADIITIGPGSFFTSLLATLLFDGMISTLRQTPATIVFVCNTTTQTGQTDGFRVIDHVQRLIDMLGPGTLDIVLINRTPNLSSALLNQYRAEGIHPLTPDDAEIAQVAALGVRPIVASLIEITEQKRPLWNKQDTLRHSPQLVGQALWKIAYNQDTPHDDTTRG
ncbi:MAG: YvcK family protein [Chloroflexaceae bacterium]|nr:YvcK family protein [Chloroflexaceae bacterium]